MTLWDGEETRTNGSKAIGAPRRHIQISEAQHLHEEALRQHFLVQLNGQFEARRPV